MKNGFRQGDSLKPKIFKHFWMKHKKTKWKIQRRIKMDNRILNVIIM